MVPGNFPIGCLPVYLTGFNTDNPDDYDENHCLKGLNSFATLHNSLLKKAISELQKENPQVTIAYGDYYGAFQHLLQIAKSRGTSARLSLYLYQFDFLGGWYIMMRNIMWILWTNFWTRF